MALTCGCDIQCARHAAVEALEKALELVLPLAKTYVGLFPAGRPTNFFDAADKALAAARQGKEKT